MGEFEKDIRDMFADFELQIDTEEIWPGIERKLERSKRKKRFLWWWFTPLLLALPLGYFYALQNGENDVKSAMMKSMSDEIKEGKNLISNEELVKNKMPDDNNKLKNDWKASLPENNKKYSVKSYTLKNSKLDTKTSKTNSFSEIKENPVSLQSDNDVIKKEEASNISSLNESNIVVYDKTELLNSPVKPFNYLRSFMPEIKNYLQISEKKPESTNWERSLDIALGFAFADKFLRPADESFNSYKKKRLNTESHLEAITASIKHQVKHRSGLFLNAGINYCQIDEKFSDFDSVDLFKSGDGIISIITNPDGSSIEERGKKEIIEHKTWNKKIYNYYFFFDIPVNIGYSGKIRKINYEISSGISYNLSFLKKGQIIGIYNYPVNIDKESGIFRTHSGFSFNSGMKILIPFSNHSFFIEPNLKYNLQSITSSEYPLSQKYLTYGIEIGSRIKL